MKQKDLIRLGIAVIILCAAGILIFSQLAPKKSSGKAKYTYEDVQPIYPEYDAAVLSEISNSTLVRDFYIPPDLNTGIGNQTPFKPIN